MASPLARARLNHRFFRFQLAARDGRLVFASSIPSLCMTRALSRPRPRPATAADMRGCFRCTLSSSSSRPHRLLVLSATRPRRLRDRYGPL